MMLNAGHVRGPISIVNEEWEDLKPEDANQSAIIYILDARESKKEGKSSGLKKMTSLDLKEREKKKYFDKKTKR